MTGHIIYDPEGIWEPPTPEWLDGDPYPLPVMDNPSLSLSRLPEVNDMQTCVQCSHPLRRHNHLGCVVGECECMVLDTDIAIDPTLVAPQIERNEAVATVKRVEHRPEPITAAAPPHPMPKAVVDAEAIARGGTGRTAYLDAIPAAAMFVDHTYQRDLNTARVARMVDDFDVTLVGVLEVSDRGDGRYAIIEGQHRWAAAKEAHPGRHRPNGLHLPCQVHKGMSVEDEARLFLELERKRKPLGWWDQWKARRAQGEPVIVSIENTAAMFGLRVDPAPKDGNVGALAVLERIVQLGDIALLAKTFETVTGAYGRARDGHDGQILHGVALVHALYDEGDEFSLQRLINALQETPPRLLKARATAMREAVRAELPRLVAAVIVDRYNAMPGKAIEPVLMRAKPPSKIGGPDGRKSLELARIRRWAIRNGHPHEAQGRVPTETINAYYARSAA